MREYNVALKEGIDYDEFWNDMESDTNSGKLYIPNRAVEFTNERPGSLRQCWYLLTDIEAEILREDDRVYCVEIPPDHRTDMAIRRIADDLARIGNEQHENLLAGDKIMSDKGYTLSTHEKQALFEKKRNFKYEGGKYESGL